MPYELVYGYCHCFGKTTYRHGLAASEAEARRWVAMERGDDRRPVPPAVIRCGLARSPVARDMSSAPGSLIAA